MKTHGGLYVTLFPDGKISKEIVDNSGEAVEVETTVTEDLLYYANMLYEPYENVMGYIEKLLSARCQCCGRFFVPKTKKTTLYCDRRYLGKIVVS